VVLRGSLCLLTVLLWRRLWVPRARFQLISGVAVLPHGANLHYSPASRRLCLHGIYHCGSLWDCRFPVAKASEQVLDGPGPLSCCSVFSHRYSLSLWDLYMPCVQIAKDKSWLVWTGLEKAEFNYGNHVSFGIKRYSWDFHTLWCERLRTE
jgi:hypothetical protein